MDNNNFKVGDRVCCDGFVFNVGTIEAIYNSGWVLVHWDTGGFQQWESAEIIPAPKLSEKEKKDLLK